MPRSPWLASAGCIKKAGVPVDASVAAILLLTCPDLPMPVTTIRPGVSMHNWQAATKSSLRRDLSESTARASMSRTLAANASSSFFVSVSGNGRPQQFHCPYSICFELNVLCDDITIVSDERNQQCEPLEA